MPVTDTHPDYDLFYPLWRKCRLAIEGEDAVKGAGTFILPKMGGMDTTEYNAYKERAMFFTATYRTVKGLAGTVMRKPLTYEGIKEDDEILKKAGVNGESFNSIAYKGTEENLGVGRVGFLVDAREGSQEPYVATYKTEDITNWRYADIDGRKKLIMVTLREEYEQYDEDDYFKVEKKTQYRVLKLMRPGTSKDEDAVEIPSAIGETGLVYVQEVWRESTGEDKVATWEVASITYPTMAGNRPIDFIPFEIVVADPASTELDKSPVLDLTNINMSHYKTSADLEHGRHFTALPTPWTAGFEAPKNGKLQIGGSTAWISDNAQAKAGYLEFSGEGLGSLERALTEKEKLMSVLGARLLEQQTLDSEAAETVKLRHQGEGSVLLSIALSVQGGMNTILNWMLLWKSEAKEAVVSINKDFNVVHIDPTMVQQLMLALQTNSISWNTWFYNLKKGEVIPPDITAEDEMSLIESNPNNLGIGGIEEDEL